MEKKKTRKASSRKGKKTKIKEKRGTISSRRTNERVWKRKQWEKRMRLKIGGMKTSTEENERTERNIKKEKEKQGKKTMKGKKEWDLK